MASIKDSIDEAVAEKLAFVKYPLLAIPVCVTYELFKHGDMSSFYFAGGITFLILITVLVKAIYNSCNNGTDLVPIFNVLDFIFSMAKLSVAILPVIGVLGYFGYWLTGLKLPIDLPNIQLIYSIIVWLLIGSVMLTSVINYSRKERIGDAYNIVILFKHSIDILVGIIFLIPQIALFNAILVGILVYLFWVFYTLDSLAFAYLCSVVIVFNTVLLGNYFSQMNYESITRKDIEEKDFTME